MSWVGFLIVGIILLIIAWYSPRFPAPPPVTTILNIIGWVCVAIAIILLVAGLLGLAVPLVR